MAKAKIKKSVKKIKISKTKTRKKSGSAQVKRNKIKKNKQETGPDIMFDSKIGKTDALFVSDPENTSPQVPGAIESSPEVILDPVIDQAIKEFDDLQKPKNEINNLNYTNSQQQPKEDINDSPKKTFWQKLFSFMNKLK